MADETKTRIVAVAKFFDGTLGALSEHNDLSPRTGDNVTLEPVGTLSLGRSPGNPVVVAIGSGITLDGIRYAEVAAPTLAGVTSLTHNSLN